MNNDKSSNLYIYSVLLADSSTHNIALCTNNALLPGSGHPSVDHRRCVAIASFLRWSRIAGDTAQFSLSRAYLLAFTVAFSDEIRNTSVPLSRFKNCALGDWHRTGADTDSSTVSGSSFVVYLSPSCIAAACLTLSLR